MFDAVAVDAMPPGPELAQALLSCDRDRLDTGEALIWLRACNRLEAHYDACRYAVLAHYADLHPPETDDDGVIRSHDERAVHPGGAGTPAVAEFAVTDLAMATGCATGRAEGLVGDGLDLRHRMPTLFARLRAGEVSGFKVRMVLRAARGLSELAARRLDERVAPIVDKIGPKRLDREIEKILLEVDPGEADRRAGAAQATRRVTIAADEHGDRRIFGYVDALDGIRFDAALDRVADILEDLGDTRPKDVRRAAAVGWLANPVATLALVDRHRRCAAGEQPLPWPTSTIGTSTDDRGDTHLNPGLWRMDVPTPHDLIDPRLWPATTVVVHLDNDTWQTGHGPVEVKGHGPITAEQAFTHLRHSQVTVRPVVDLNDDVAWVRGDGPFTGTLREAVWLAHPWSPFPFADTETRDDDDADHTVPRRLGGATILENGAPLRRRQHRYKTFAKGVRVKQPVPGVLVWQDRHGRVYVCDRRGHTHDLGRVGTEDHSRARSAG